MWLLEKILAINSLSEEQYESVKNMLLNKLKIFANGLKKREKVQELKIVEKKIQDWTAMSN